MEKDARWSPSSADWIVHGPPDADPTLTSLATFRPNPALRLVRGVRYHLAKSIDEYGSGLLGERVDTDLPALAARLEGSEYHLRITRDLDEAKAYLRERYRDDPTARYGLIASAQGPRSVGDAVVVFVPPLGPLDETYADLVSNGLLVTQASYGDGSGLAMGTVPLDGSLAPWYR